MTVRGIELSKEFEQWKARMLTVADRRSAIHRMTFEEWLCRRIESAECLVRMLTTQIDELRG